MLTPTQLAVLKLLARGLTSPQAAEELGMSMETVRKHTAAARKNLGVHTNAHLCCIAIPEGWIEPVRHGDR